MSHANAVIHKNHLIEKENQGLFTVDIRILAQIELFYYYSDDTCSKNKRAYILRPFISFYHSPCIFELISAAPEPIAAATIIQTIVPTIVNSSFFI